MEISGNFSLAGVQSLKGASRTPSTPATSATSESSILAPVDQLDLSPEAQALGEATNDNSEIRTEKVAALRRAIAEGTYDSPERMSAALDKFLEQLG